MYTLHDIILILLAAFVGCVIGTIAGLAIIGTIWLIVWGILRIIKMIFRSN